MTEIADLLHEDNELAGKITFKLEDAQIFDQSVKDVTIFYKLVGDSRFKMHRNDQFELVFLRLTEDWMRQAKLPLRGVACDQGVEVILTWNENVDTLAVRGLGDENCNYLVVRAVQFDD